MRSRRDFLKVLGIGGFTAAVTNVERVAKPPGWLGGLIKPDSEIVVPNPEIQPYAFDDVLMRNPCSEIVLPRVHDPIEWAEIDTLGQLNRQRESRALIDRHFGRDYQVMVSHMKQDSSYTMYPGVRQKYVESQDGLAKVRITQQYDPVQAGVRVTADLLTRPHSVPVRKPEPMHWGEKHPHEAFPDHTFEVQHREADHWFASRMVTDEEVWRHEASVATKVENGKEA